MNVQPPAITSRSEFIAAIAWGFSQAMDTGARRIVCVDRDFADWPLDERALHTGLAAWLRRPQRKLVLLAADYTAMQRRHPRFVSWRRLWAHGIETWSPPHEAAADLPTLLVDDANTSVHLVDAVHWRGRAASAAGVARLWHDRIDAVLQRSEPGLAVKCLGL